MANCSHCGSEVGAGARFCETCGQPVAVAPHSSVPPTVLSAVPDRAVSVPTRSAERAGRGFRHWLSIVTFLGAIVWIIAPWWALWVLYTTHVRSGVLTNTELHSIETGIFFVSAGIVLLVGVASIVVAVTSTASMGKKLTGSLLGLVFIGIGVGAAVAPWTFLAVEQFAPVHVLLLVLLFFAWAIPRPFRGPGYFSLLVGVPVLFILVGLTFVPMLGWQIGLSPIVAQVALSILIVGAIVFSTWMAVTLESRALRAVSPPPNMSATLSNQVGVADRKSVV